MQAARGAAVGPDVRPPGVPRTSHRVWILAVFALVFTTDQVTKVLAARHLADGRERPLLGHLLQLHLTRNAGAAFSAGTGYTAVLSCLAIAAVLVVLWLARRVGSPLWATAFGLLLAGVGGNLADRVFRSPGPLRGHVVDFLQLPHWPIFNVADVSINLAAALILVQVVRGVRLDGLRADPDPDPDPDDAGHPGDTGDSDRAGAR